MKEQIRVGEKAAPLLRPRGWLVSGKPGVSASRLADLLEVPLSVVKRVVQPVGMMKMPYRPPFPVYDPLVFAKIRNHPDIIRARKGSVKNVNPLIRITTS